jgi:23S rRNA pseudouridine2604 synthase
VAQDQTLRFILTEGRNRQIRRMCELVGLHVVDLVRVRIGPLQLADLPEGRWRMLSAQEREALIVASAPRPAGRSSRPGPASHPGSSG